MAVTGPTVRLGMPEDERRRLMGSLGDIASIAQQLWDSLAGDVLDAQDAANMARFPVLVDEFVRAIDAHARYRPGVITGTAGEGR